MAVHTTVAKVEAVMRAFDKKKDLSTSTFILPANNLVRRYCEPLGYDEETLELIERYLAAHFYCVTARRPVEQYVGQARNRYEDNVGLGLDATWYGQQAKLFDSLGRTLTNVPDWHQTFLRIATTSSGPCICSLRVVSFQ